MDLQSQLQATLGDAYRLERELGGGGMSRTFVATEMSLGRRVVVKVLPPELAVGLSTDRFRKEIQFAASLQHPHIVSVLAAGIQDGLLYYTMPFIDGPSLRARLSQSGELPVAEAVRILREITRAIAYAHRHGVVHRDLKPDNILLSEDGAMVADFGIAKALTAATGGGDQVRTGTGVILGTPAYMAPEQAAGDPTTDHRADLYALGMIGYELLAGYSPFAGRTMNAMLAAHASEVPEQVNKRRAGLPLRLGALVMQCIEKRPANRPQSADEILRELDAIAHEIQGATSSMGGPAVGRAPVRRTRMLVGAGALILAVAATGGYFALHPSDAPLEHSLGVLPFRNLSSDKSDDAFSDGMTEELISALGKVDGLRVKSASSFKESRADSHDLGKQLGVESILEASVRRSGGTLRITASLVNVADGTLKWTDKYDRELRSAGDVFSVQDELARAIVGALEHRLGSKPIAARRSTENLDAYNLYQRGRYFWNKRTPDGIRTAIQFFDSALVVDPKFALAYDGLADAHALSHTYGFVEPGQAFGAARKAVARALDLDSTMAEAYATLGYIGLSNTWDWGATELAFKRAIQLNPKYPHAHQWYSLYLDAMGRGQDALAEMQRALELDPVSLIINREYGRSYYYMGDNERALKQYQRTAELDPTFSSVHVWMARVFIAQRRYADAIRELEDRADFQGGHSSALLSYAYARSGDERKARALLDELVARGRRENVWPMYVALIQLGLGNRAGALTLLEEEYTRRSAQMAYLKVDPMFAELHGDPRFEALLRKMQFPR